MENTEIIDTVYYTTDEYYGELDSTQLSHFHQTYEIMYITEGELDVSVNEKKYHAVPGDVLVFSNLEFHDVCISKIPYHRYILRLNVSNTESALSNIDLISLLKYHSNNFCHKINISESMQEANYIFDKMIKEWKSEPTIFRHELISAYIKELIVLLYRHTNTYIPLKNNKLYMQIYLIQKYLDTNYQNQINIEQLAKDNYMSHHYMTHMFKDYTGLSPRQYLTLVRLNAAARLLTATNDTIIDISLACGFSDINNFIKCFKQKFNMTPNNYRKIFLSDVRGNLKEHS